MISFTKTSFRIGAAMALVGMGAGALQAPVIAQAVSDPFNIPQDVQILGKMDPNKRSATARVNGNIITGTDIDQRLALLLASNNQQLAEDQVQEARLEVLRSLIDETLQIQEATAQEMPVSEDQINNTFARLAAERYQMSPDDLAKYLASVGSSAGSIKRQIQGELAWENLLRRNVAPFVNVSSSEVDDTYKRMQDARGSTQYRIGEIFLASTPATHAAVRANAEQILEQLRAGGSFVAYARQFSDASTAATGGDLGWIKLEQLQNPTLEQTASQLTPGQVAGPVEIPGGFSLLLLIDKRQVGTADPRDALLSLKQISLDFPAGTTQEQAQTRAREFAAAVEGMNGCGDANAKAAAIGATTVDNDQIAVRALPEILQQNILALNVGQATAPFGDLSGVRVLMVCGRDDPKVNDGPSRDQLANQLENDRINKRAERYLRDLRRDAVIEYN